jgi:hypothetical protein
MDSEFVETEEAATFLGVSIRYLEKLRHCRRGPKFFKDGSIVRYSKTALREYVRKMTVVTNNRWPRNVEV